MGRWSGIADINSYTNAIAVVEQLQMLRDEIGIAIIAVHHNRKNRSEGAKAAP